VQFSKPNTGADIDFVLLFRAPDPIQKYGHIAGILAQHGALEVNMSAWQHIQPLQ
jgi:hypothetical protein